MTAVGAFLLVGNPSGPQQVERTAVITRGSVTASVTGSGNAASQVSTPINFESSGVVSAVNVKPGDAVTLGEVLATIDPDSAQAGLRSAQAQLDGAKAALAQAQSGPTAVKAQQDALAHGRRTLDALAHEAARPGPPSRQGIDRRPRRSPRSPRADEAAPRPAASPTEHRQDGTVAVRRPHRSASKLGRGGRRQARP